MLDYYNILYNEKSNIHYLIRYINFIKSIQSKGIRDLEYSEVHHIIPKCIKIDYYKHPDNKIKLTAREHYIAHKILAYCYTHDSCYNNKLVHAWFCMTKLKMGNHKRYFHITSREYEILRRKYSDSMKEIQKRRMLTGKWDNFVGKGKPAPNRGMIWITNGINNAYIHKNDIIPEGWYKGNIQNRNEEIHRKKLKEAWIKNKENRTGKNHPMFGKGYLLIGERNGMYGRHRKYIHNGCINKLIFIEDLPSYIELGWELGRVNTEKFIYVYKDNEVKRIKLIELDLYTAAGWLHGNPKSSRSGVQNGVYGKKWINNGEVNKLVNKDEVESYIKNNWKLGSLHYKNNLN